MNKIYLFGLACLFSLHTHAQTADDIINKYYESTGGRALWAKVTSIKSKGHYVMGPGALAPFEEFTSQASSFSSFTWNGMSSKSARKGDAGWSYNPFGGKRVADPMTPDQIRESKLMAEPQGLIYDYAAKGFTAEYLGIEDFDGTDVHKIRLISKQGDMIYYYFDKESGYLLKIYMRIKLSDKEEKSTIHFSDFKKTTFGIILPFARNWANENGEEGGLVQWKEVDVNANIDAALLEMPK